MILFDNIYEETQPIIELILATKATYYTWCPDGTTVTVKLHDELIGWGDTMTLTFTHKETRTCPDTYIYVETNGYKNERGREADIIYYFLGPHGIKDIKEVEVKLP